MFRHVHTTHDLAAGCSIRAFVMNRRLMGQKGKEEKEKEKKLRKKNIVQIQFWNIYSTAYKGGIFENIKKKREEIKGTITRNPSKRYPYPLIPR